MQNDVTSRVQELVDLRFGGNWAELARQMNVSYSILQSLKSGGDPRVSTLLKVAEALNTSLDWLVRGIGPMCLELGPDTQYSSPGLSPTPHKHVMTFHDERHGVSVDALDIERHRQEEEVLGDLGLGEVSLLARRGTQYGIWNLLKCLETFFPGAATFQELMAVALDDGPEVTEREFASDLALSLRCGLVTVVESQDGEPRKYKAALSASELTPRSVADLSQLAQEAVRELLRTILPITERDQTRGAILTSVLNLPTGEGTRLISELKQFTKARLIDAARSAGTERMSIVFGVALDHNVT